MSTKIRVAVIDDHPLFREGVVHMFSACPDIEVLAQGTSAQDAVRIAKTKMPDVLVLDISIPGCGITALETIAEACPGAKVLMLTVSVDDADVLKAWKLGAKGYVVKGVSGPELIEALRAVNGGQRYLSPILGAKLLSGLEKQGTRTGLCETANSLSEREAQILTFLGQGLSNKEIGSRLQLSEKTIKHYLTNLFNKLKVRNRVEAALLVQRSGAAAEWQRNAVDG